MARIFAVFVYVNFVEEFNPGHISEFYTINSVPVSVFLSYFVYLSSCLFVCLFVCYFMYLFPTDLLSSVQALVE